MPTIRTPSRTQLICMGIGGRPSADSSFTWRIFIHLREVTEGQEGVERVRLGHSGQAKSQRVRRGHSGSGGVTGGQAGSQRVRRVTEGQAGSQGVRREHCGATEGQAWSKRGLEGAGGGGIRGPRLPE